MLRSLVARDRLADVIRAAGRRRLILINVPSGYGKSTLAAQWRELLMREGVAVAWLTVDDDDNNAVWFLAHLLESIRMIRPALAASLAQVLEEHGDDSAVDSSEMRAKGLFVASFEMRACGAPS